LNGFLLLLNAARLNPSKFFDNFQLVLAFSLANNEVSNGAVRGVVIESWKQGVFVCARDGWH
jgi:hypothetical protein